MDRNPCSARDGLNRGAWSSQEDEILKDYVKKHGEGKWRTVAQKAGLKRSGKSCRLRWLNYLRPDIKRGDISADEEDLIIRLHNLLGNRWALIAGRLPGRTDNEIKNYWNTNLAKKLHGQTSKSPIKPLKSEEKKPNHEEFESEEKKPNRQEFEVKSPASSTPLEGSSLNFLMDIDVNDFFIPEVLCSDLPLMHQNGNRAGYNYYSSSSSWDCPFSGSECLLENEMIERNPLQPTLDLELKKVASFQDLED